MFLTFVSTMGKNTNNNSGGRPKKRPADKKPRLTGAERYRVKNVEKTLQAAKGCSTLVFKNSAASTSGAGPSTSSPSPTSASHSPTIVLDNEDSDIEMVVVEQYDDDEEHVSTETAGAKISTETVKSSDILDDEPDLHPSDSEESHDEDVEEVQGQCASASEVDGDGESETENVPKRTRADPKDFLEIAKVTDKHRKDFIRNSPLQPGESHLPSAIKHLATYYNEPVKVGCVTVKRPRAWLSYSIKLDKIFCVVCMAFSKDSDTNVLKEGSCDWHNMARIKTHHESPCHKNASDTMSRVMCDKGIDSIILKNNEIQLSVRRQKAQELRFYLYRIIDILRFLCASCDSLQGAKETSFYTNAKENPKYQQGAGKFLNLVNLLSSYDDLLKNKLIDVRANHDYSSKKRKGRGNRLTFLSNYTQNKLNATMASLVRRKIKNEIDEVDFFSLSADGTTDISLCEQLVVVLRYIVDTPSGDNSKVQVVERMIDLKMLESTTGENSAKAILDILNAHNIDIKRCIGQSYDGAANMQGGEKGVATRIKEHAPMSVNIYCEAHGTNLCNKATAHSSVDAVNLYGTDSKPGELQKLKTFFMDMRESENKFCTIIVNDILKRRNLPQHTISDSQPQLMPLCDVYSCIVQSSKA